MAKKHTGTDKRYVRRDETGRFKEGDDVAASAEVASVPVGTVIFPLKTLLARPRLDQRAIDGEVLIGHQALRPFDHAAEDTAGYLLIEATRTS